MADPPSLFDPPDEPEEPDEPKRPEGFDAERSAAARDEGMQHADEGATDEWKEEADAAIEKCAYSMPELTADDVWATGLGPTKQPKALGPRITAAAGRGLIVATDRTINSTRVAAHRGPKRVWKSLVYEPGKLVDVLRGPGGR